MNVGDVIFKFIGKTDDIEKKTSNLSSKLKGIASTGAKAFTGLATVAGTALIGITKKAVDMRGEVEQQIGGTEAVFKEFASTVQDDASKSFDKMGLSANEYMQYINKMGSLMKGSGIDTKTAMELSSQAMQRASDVASIMGVDINSAMESIAGASKGNFTMMDNLGVAMNTTSLSAYALSKGMKKTYKEMSQGEKVQLAMQMFMEKTSDYAGNYAKENKTLAGSFTTLKASAQNLLAGTGNVGQVITAIQNFGKVLAENLIQILPDIVNGLVGLLNGLVPLIPPLLQAVLPSLVQGITDLTLALIDYLPDIINLIADMLPTLIPQIVNAIMLLIPAIVKNTPAFLKAGWNLIKALVKGLWDAIKSSLGQIGKWCLDILSTISKALGLDKLAKIGVNMVKGLWNGLNNSVSWIKSKIKGWVGDVMKFIKKLFGISSPSKEFAIIGKYNVMGLEKGMEDEKLKLQDTFNEMFDLSPNLYGSTSTNLSPIVNVTNNINMKQDTLGQMVNDIKTFSGGAKNDYSYGMGA